MTERQRRSAEIRRLIERGFYSMAFQPICFAGSRKIHGYESLLRGPKDSVLEQPGEVFSGRMSVPNRLMHTLDMACVGSALRTGRILAENARLFINIHGTSLAKLSKKTSYFLDLLAELGIAPDRVVFEISENTHHMHAEAIARELTQLRTAGVRIAIDDIGTRYPWHQHMYWLEPEYIKLDRSLVDSIDHDGRKKALVHGLVLMAKRMGSLVIAEGVERTAELNELFGIGVDFVQGFLVGMPLPAERWSGSTGLVKLPFRPLSGIIDNIATF